MDLHPLILPEILRNVFKFAGLSDLLKCREVCKVWDKEASAFIAEEKLICINDVQKLKELHDLINGNPAQPFRNFELWSFPIDLDEERMVSYFSNCGEYFHHLTLNFDKDSDKQLNIRGLRDLILYYTPNLKSLSIRQLPQNILSQSSLFPPGSERIFRQPILPLLKCLTIYSDGDLNAGFLSSIFKATGNLRHINVEYGDEPRDFKKSFLSALFGSLSYLRNLESLQYFLHDPGAGEDWAWTQEECTKLAESKLSLKSIKLHPSGKFETKIMFNLLGKIGNTLETLKLRVHDELQCPSLLRLKSLTIYDYEGSLLFLDQLPNLKHLGLCEYSPSKCLTPDNIISNKRQHGILSLNFYGSSAIPNHLFRVIAKSFPELRVLNYWHMSNAKMLTVIENFPLLEELVMNVVDVDDGAISGFPTDLCEEIERMGNYKEYMTHPEVYRTQPFIGDLKYLRRLEMHGACLAEWKWSNISDVSVYCGLIHLKNLTSVSFYEFKWITDAAILELCKSTPLNYMKLDSRVFPESLISTILSVRPDLRYESVTDALEYYHSSFVCMR